jgi:hypothetical protein
MSSLFGQASLQRPRSVACRAEFVPITPADSEDNKGLIDVGRSLNPGHADRIYKVEPIIIEEDKGIRCRLAKINLRMGYISAPFHAIGWVCWMAR